MLTPIALDSAALPYSLLLLPAYTQALRICYSYQKPTASCFHSSCHPLFVCRCISDHLCSHMEKSPATSARHWHSKQSGHYGSPVLHKEQDLSLNPFRCR